MATKCRIIYKNLWRIGTIIAKTTQDPRYPAEDTQCDTPLQPWRSTALTTQNLDIDLGAAYQYDFVALLNHNLTSGATITIYGADDSGFTTNVVSDAITHNSLNIFFFLAAARSKRYLRISVADTGNSNSFLQLGTIIVGKYWEPAFSFLKDYEDGVEDASEIDTSDAQANFSSEKTPLGIQSLPFRLTNADKVTAGLFQREVGLTKAFILCTDYSAPNSSSYYVQNTELTSPAYRAVNNWEWSLIFKEAV
jgi:hypothetical protein